jgi:hypothetical protein
MQPLEAATPQGDEFADTSSTRAVPQSFITEPGVTQGTQKNFPVNSLFLREFRIPDFLEASSFSEDGDASPVGGAPC